MDAESLSKLYQLRPNTGELFQRLIVVYREQNNQRALLTHLLDQIGHLEIHHLDLLVETAQALGAVDVAVQGLERRIDGEPKFKALTSLQRYIGREGDTSRPVFNFGLQRAFAQTQSRPLRFSNARLMQFCWRKTLRRRILTPSVQLVSNCGLSLERIKLFIEALEMAPSQTKRFYHLCEASVVSNRFDDPSLRRIVASFYGEHHAPEMALGLLRSALQKDRITPAEAASLLHDYGSLDSASSDSVVFGLYPMLKPHCCDPRRAFELCRYWLEDRTQDATLQDYVMPLALAHPTHEEVHQILERLVVECNLENFVIDVLERLIELPMPARDWVERADQLFVLKSRQETDLDDLLELALKLWEMGGIPRRVSRESSFWKASWAFG